MMGVELVAKRLELLRELLPGATRIAVLVNPNNPGVTQNVIQHTQVAARRLGLEIVVVEAATEREIESSIAIAVRQQAEALSIGNDAYLSSRSRQIAFLALRHALPTMAFTREFVAAGILMSYGSSQTDSFRLAGVYVGRILKGDMPANLPVIQPTKFELFINLTTATALGLKISDNLLSLADEVIE
jgi:putative tryptophan/tyrosine transport system substrate-binding protein